MKIAEEKDYALSERRGREARGEEREEEESIEMKTSTRSRGENYRLSFRSKMDTLGKKALDLRIYKLELSIGAHLHFKTVPENELHISTASYSAQRDLSQV